MSRLRGVQPFGISEAISVRRGRVALGHTLNTWRHIITKDTVLSRFTILCWAEFVAVLSCMWPVGCRLDSPGSRENTDPLVQLRLDPMPSPLKLTM